MKTIDEVIKIKLRSNSLMDVRDEGEKEELTNSQYGKQGNDTYAGVEKEVRVNNQFKT